MKKQVLSAFDIFLIIGVILSNVAYSILCNELDVLGSLACVTGVLCVVLVAKGNIWNYAFGLVNVSLYAWISYKSSLYGDAGLNALYYLPMQFVGWWQWRKRMGEGSQQQVNARRMDMVQRVLLGLGCAVAVVAVGFLLKYLNDPQPFKDSATSVLSIVAQALMALAFMEQWFLWIITNIISVVMWCVAMSRGDAHAGMMVIMWVFYLLNSLNGLRVWMKLSKR